ncbi:MAG: gamma-glutamyl-gamma-aminobutyrate hydrolase family protein [Xanthomonadales bacterium]|nr:gamma-glutamyl-gamma-aminobutyrate hydrolase family protein [Xanthomonadales bacterium]
MSRVLVFQHVAAEPLGTLDALLRERGHRLRFCNFERQPLAQPTIDRYHGLIVLGGPMNVDESDRRPHLRTELKVIEAALKADKPVLGICLGAQLLAHVLGAPIRRLQTPEIGWYRLEPTEHAASDPIMHPMAEPTHVFQWHSYGFDLPSGAQRLASTAQWPDQAFRYGERAYGMQFHLEMDAPLINRWLSTPEYWHELAQVGMDPEAQPIRSATDEHIGPMQNIASEVFGGFLDLVGRPNRRIVLPSR